MDAGIVKEDRQLRRIEKRRPQRGEVMIVAAGPDPIEGITEALLDLLGPAALTIAGSAAEPERTP